MEIAVGGGSVSVQIGGAAPSASNPMPVIVTTGGTNTSATNPQAVQLSQANAAITAANPVPVLTNGGANPAAAMSPTNPMYATDTVFGDNVSKGGGAAAPTAGTAFVSYAGNALAAGRHRITIMYSISGAAEVASSGANVRLSDASAGFTSIDFPSNNGGVPGVVFGPITVEVTVGAANTVKLTAVANATASTVYAGTMVAKRIS
jgi:hypothetical protein